MDYDRSECTAASVCGNGIIEAGEECDEINFGGMTCEGVVGKGSDGNLRCQDCRIFADECSAASTCGNGKIDGSDLCDGDTLGNATCQSVVGAGSVGIIKCSSNCRYDISGCSAAAKCGNHLIESGEICDGERLNDRTCETEVGPGSKGMLQCNKTCTGFITDNCSVPAFCGNGIIDGNEECDNNEFKDNINMCAKYDAMTYRSGMLKCSDCQIDTSACTSYCGDGVIQTSRGELCDGQNFLAGANTCGNVLGDGFEGTLKCSDDCSYIITDGCAETQKCNDGTLGDNEFCDGNLFHPGMDTCNDWISGTVGILQCTSECDVDFSGCKMDYNNIVTMNDWFASNMSSYNTQHTQTFSDGSKVTVTASFYVSDHIIDGVTAVLNAAHNSTKVEITDLTYGIGTISFKYMIWGNSADSLILNITDGVMSKKLSVVGTEQYVKTATFVFNNPVAKTVTIIPESKSNAARVLIDDIRYTSTP